MRTLDVRTLELFLSAPQVASTAGQKQFSFLSQCAVAVPSTSVEDGTNGMRLIAGPGPRGVIRGKSSGCLHFLFFYIISTSAVSFGPLVFT